MSGGGLAKHDGHTIEMFHKDTLILLGWGHLEAKLHSCLIRVFIHYLYHKYKYHILCKFRYEEIKLRFSVKFTLSVKLKVKGPVSHL